MLTNLKELDLSMNLYTQMPDQLLWKDSHLATSLTKLSINQNRIQVIPDDIQEMKSLQVPFSARLFVWVRARARACVRVVFGQAAQGRRRWDAIPGVHRPVVTSNFCTRVSSNFVDRPPRA